MNSEACSDTNCEQLIIAAGLNANILHHARQMRLFTREGAYRLAMPQALNTTTAMWQMWALHESSIRSVR